MPKGNEKVYKVTFSYSKKYVNSWDILHRRTPVREEVVNATSKIYVIASNKEDIAAILNEKGFTNPNIIKTEKQPLYFFTWADDDEGGIGVSINKDNIPRRHHFYGNIDGNNTIADIATAFVKNRIDFSNPTFEESLQEIYDIVDDEISYLNETTFDLY